MFYKVKEAYPRANKTLAVLFANGTTKLYDMAPLIKKHSAFAPLKSDELFQLVSVDPGGYGVSWSDDIDISCDELWDNGQPVETPFDGLMSFADASELWGLSESTLRKAIAYGKIESGTDARKYGKQWVVTRDAMMREYGDPLVRA